MFGKWIFDGAQGGVYFWECWTCLPTRMRVGGGVVDLPPTNHRVLGFPYSLVDLLVVGPKTRFKNQFVLFLGSYLAAFYLCTPIVPLVK